MKNNLNIIAAAINYLTLTICMRDLCDKFNIVTLIILIIVSILLCYNSYSILKYYGKNNQ